MSPSPCGPRRDRRSRRAQLRVVVGTNSALFERCTFQRAGEAPNDRLGSIISAPASCFDLEAEEAECRNLVIRAVQIDFRPEQFDRVRGRQRQVQRYSDRRHTVGRRGLDVQASDHLQPLPNLRHLRQAQRRTRPAARQQQYRPLHALGLAAIRGQRHRSTPRDRPPGRRFGGYDQRNDDQRRAYAPQPRGGILRDVIINFELGSTGSRTELTRSSPTAPYSMASKSTIVFRLRPSHAMPSSSPPHVHRPTRLSHRTGNCCGTAGHARRTAMRVEFRT